MSASTSMNTNPADLSRADFDALFTQLLNEKPVKEQSVVKARIIDIGPDRVTVDIGYKAESTLPTDRFMVDGAIGIEVGQEIDVFLEAVEDEEGQMVLSKEKADLMKAWEEISKAVEREETVSGMIKGRVKGGLSVDIGVPAFLPGSQVDLRPVKNLEKLLGQTYEFKIIKFNKKRGNIVLSRRALLEKERTEKRRETMGRLQEGSIMKGVIKNITDYGAFVDLGGIDGLLHITDMSYGRIQHPSELFEVGQEIEVRVQKFDPNTERVSLGYKQIRNDPWEEADYKYPKGAIVRGRVVSIPDYGAFIELEEGIEGLVHISEMTWNRRLKHPSKLVNVGDMVEAQVLGVDMENKRISLGMRQLEENPWDRLEQTYPPDSIVRGKVRNITEFGIFIGIEEGIDGLVHISDISHGQRVKHPGERFKKGDDVEAKVLHIDRENERISLSIKDLRGNPWETAHIRYYVGQALVGPVVHKADFGVFIELEEGVEGLIHTSELMHKGDDWIDAYELGQKVHAMVLSVGSAQDRRISLSERSPEEVAEKPPGTVQSEARASLGDLMGDIAGKFRNN